MAETATNPATGVQEVVRDDAWKREVARESVRAVVEREARSLPASLIAWSVLLVAALSLAKPALLVGTLILRLMSLGLVRHVGGRMRTELANNQDTTASINLLTAAMIFSGITWGMLLYPYPGMVPGDPVMVTIRGVVIVGVAIVAVTFGPLRAPMLAMVGSFTLTVWAILVVRADELSPVLGLTVGALALGIVAYSLGAAKQHVNASEMLVDNRRLSEDLADALAQAEFLSQRDPLTGLLNRRAFFEDDAPPKTSEELRHLLAIDLDHFKAINDRFGHAAGDRVLAATADEMRAILKPLREEAHRAVRLGGEEFAILVEGVDRATAASLAEALRLRIERIPDTLGEPEMQVTASIGIAECPPGNSIDDALRRSDLAMYRAKDRGRNQVMTEAA